MDYGYSLSKIHSPLSIVHSPLFQKVDYIAEMRIRARGLTATLATDGHGWKEPRRRQDRKEFRLPRMDTDGIREKQLFRHAASKGLFLGESKYPRPAVLEEPVALCFLAFYLWASVPANPPRTYIDPMS